MARHSEELRDRPCGRGWWHEVCHAVIRGHAWPLGALRGAGIPLLTLMCVAFSPVSRAQSLRVEAPRTVYENQRFQVTFVVDAKPTSFNPPVWGEIQKLMGPSVSQETSMQIINGNVTRNYRYSYTFVCRVARAGTHTIQAATAEADGKRLTSEPFNIEVLTSGTPQPEGQQAGQSPDGQTQGDPDIFMSLSVSKREVYQGEPIEATVRIYSRQDLVGFEDIQFPSFKGFWVKELSMPQQISFSSATVRGKHYNMGVLRRYLLYPQRRGEQEIDPVTAEVQYRVRVPARSFFDEFMGAYQTATSSVRSAPQRVHVKPLPEGKPATFTGGVGDFEVRASLQLDSLKVNDATTYTLTISGKGNLQLLSDPTLRLPATLEAFPPKREEKITHSASGQSGSIRFEYVMIPRAPGEMRIPPFEFAYFDLASGKYKIAKTQEHILRVAVDSTASSRSGVVAGNVGKEDVKYIGEDIRHIHLGAPLLHAPRVDFIGGALWWSLLLVLLLLSVLAYLLLHRRARLLSDAARARGRRAGGIARKRLRQARAHLEGDDPALYEHLLRALWSYLSDRLNIDMADLTLARCEAELALRGVSEVRISLLREVVEACEYAQYAPSRPQSDRDALYRKAQEAIEQIHLGLRERPRGGK